MKEQDVVAQGKQIAAIAKDSKKQLLSMNYEALSLQGTSQALLFKIENNRITNDLAVSLVE